FRDDAGTLNLALAQRLEVALALANDPRKPVGLLRDASAVAARTPAASHLSRAGRLRLFAARYTPAWGKGEVAADVFVTGTAQVDRNLRTLTVGLEVFDRKANKLEPFGKPFRARLEAGALAEVGASFRLRGVPAGSALADEMARQAALEAVRVQAREVKHPLE